MEELFLEVLSFFLLNSQKIQEIEKEEQKFDSEEINEKEAEKIAAHRK